MSATIPVDTHSPGDTGHTIDHNNIVDVEALFAEVLAAFAGQPGNAPPSGNSANITAIQALATAKAVTPGLMPTGTDDTSNIQGLLTLAGKAVLQPGLFYVSSMLQISSNSRLEGAGIGLTTIRMKSGSWSGVAQVGSNTGISVLQVYDGAAASYITVTGITFDGNQTGITAIPAWANQESCAPLSLLDVTGLSVTQCQAINAIGYSLYLYGCSNFSVTQCLVLSGQVSAAQGWGTPTQQDGIHVSASQYGTIAGNIVDTGTTANVGDDGIALQSWGTGTSSVHDVTITGNVVRSAASGVDLAMSGGPITNVAITGNDIWETQVNGVVATPFTTGTAIVSNVSITGNTFGQIALSGYGSGIALFDYTQVSSTGQGWQDVVVAGNSFGSCGNAGGFGVFTEQGSGLQINDNNFDSWDAYAAIGIGQSGCPVNNFQVSGNTVNAASSAAAPAFGVFVSDSHDGIVSGNTLIGNASTGSYGILLTSFDTGNVVSGVVCTDNRVSGWANAIAEYNNGGIPDYNLIADNILHNCTAGIVTTGLHTLSQQPTPDIGGVPDTEQFVVLASAYTLTSQTAAQKLTSQERIAGIQEQTERARLAIETVKGAHEASLAERQHQAAQANPGISGQQGANQ